ncbi:uncharacterized protein SPSK_05831 [Sporothrix schenckii 1099-18]|uniref:ADF-H domain-containing protein n=1 Tax=Sporothrix schenckii 1099-18 TaxID=1397361 RepID=A0A0F2MM17_SPOSC|nr:uncharacterized protein SPSK_05831 [Sporothrix schenckii 1099-18]KJR89890.1 hypothetical protein SPSK_05831 [Sporothrix schenckii 1099-18]
MSLNGLDNATVKEAHDAAVSEPGGWFLLKYTSRDEVGLLGRGSGGIVEIRNAIAHYEEASPLYGFLRYRRRNVIVKYLPEDCSRLVQARVTVHFTAVCERLAPYNTTFSIGNAKELKDTKLSAACSLHTASSSTSSSTSSLRRRRLVEIAEEEEEEQRATKRQSVVKEEGRTGPQDETGTSELTMLQPTVPPVTLNSQLAKSPDESQFSGTTDPPSFTGVERPSSPAKSLDARRMSSQLTRPEMYSYSSYPYGKPKVKLAPRPSLDTSGRPRTSAGTGTYRPVSAIPAGFKLFSKGSRKGKGDVKLSGSSTEQIDEEDKGDDATLIVTKVAAISVPVNPPETLDVHRPHTSGGRPASSSGISIKSTATTTATTVTKQNTMTPEKARLMKAMKLREKKKKMTIQPPIPIPTVDISEAPTGEVVGSILQPEEPSNMAPATGVSHTGNLEDLPNIDRLSSGNNFTSGVGSGDLAVDTGLPAAMDQISIETHTTDSHPASPLAMSSEIGDSTKASSLSESTDETVQALRDLKVETGVTSHHDSTSPGNPTSTIESSEPLYPGGGTESYKSRAEGHGSVSSGPVVQSEELPGSGMAEHDADDGVFLGEDQLVTSKSYLDKAAAFNSAPVLESADALVFAERTARAPIDEAGIEFTDSSRPTTSTTSEFTADLEDETLVPSTMVPVITAPEPRDSQSTIGLETSDTASMDTKRARRRALVDPIQTNLGGGLENDGARSDANLSDDDELMEELQSATFQQAKPMTVSKSPITPVFPNTSPSKHRVADDEVFGRVARTVSSPVRGSLLVPGDASAGAARSVSSNATFLQKIAQQKASNLAPKKTNLGSSISQRIKALEKLSGGTSGSAVEAPARAERPTSTFFSVHKPGGRDPSQSPSVAERASSLTRDKTPSPPTSRESTPEMHRLTSRDRSGSMASRLSVFENGNPPRGRPESVQVKARIIRDPTQPFPKLTESHFDPIDTNQLQFKQSPLVVDHQKATPMLTSAFTEISGLSVAGLSTETERKKESILERRASKEKRRSQSQDRSTIADGSEDTRPRRRSSLSIVKDFIKDRRGSVMASRSPSTDNLNTTNLASPASLFSHSKSPSRPPSVHTTHGLARRLSISSRRSTSKDRDMITPPTNTPLSPSLMTETSGSGDESKSFTSELGHKKTSSGGKNRASRFIRRLSSSLTTGRKSTTPTISPTVAEEEEASSTTAAPNQGDLVIQSNAISCVGDVNVQFPDNLLWKRRTMCLDSQGFLILSTGNSVGAPGIDKPAGTVKRYHISDFRLPYIPEMEVQELPNSVCLDFVDGSGLQIACEDRAGQLNILHVLQDAHQGHTSFGQ